MLGATIGRTYVPQGLALDELTWFTAKDLTHIQRINAQADNGLFLYYNARRACASIVAAISGNGNPYHDYGYFDFTDPTEDKNSALGPSAASASSCRSWSSARALPQELPQLAGRGFDFAPAVRNTTTMR